MNDPMLLKNFRVDKVIKETADVFTWHLVPARGEKPLRFEPGQFNMVYMFGVGEVPISISGDSANPETLVHTTRAVGSVTKAMAEVPRGDTVGIRGPFGTFWPMKALEGMDVVFMAGGIGLAPLRPALYHIAANRAKYGKVSLLLGARTPQDILYPGELKLWRDKYAMNTLVTVDKADRKWRGNTGVVTTLLPQADFDPERAAALVCGPEVMMRFSAQDLEARGISKNRIIVTLERNMKCGIGLCGHCQMGPEFVCKDGPVFKYSDVEKWFLIKEI